MANLSFLIIPDSFKDCMSAFDVGQNIAKGIKSVFNTSKIAIIPIADGGEGTVKCILSAINGDLNSVNVLDPLGRPIQSYLGTIDNGKTAIIEMAAASGLELLKTKERNPFITSTYGTGQLIKAALDMGCSKIIIGIGGSATNDAGMGMAKALGIKFFDSNNYELAEGGSSLLNLAYIDMSALDKRIINTKIIAATDVDSPLVGKKGASMVFSPQKGASEEMALTLEKALIQFATIIKRQLNIDIAKLKGAGAAGGLGAGLLAFLNAEFESGIKIISNLIDIEKKIPNYDIIITAEGSVDEQTIAGKAPIGVAKLAYKFSKPIFLFTGNATENTESLYQSGISSIIPITRKPSTLKTAIRNTPNWLQKSAEELCLILKCGFELHK